MGVYFSSKIYKDLEFALVKFLRKLKDPRELFEKCMKIIVDCENKSREIEDNYRLNFVKYLNEIKRNYCDDKKYIEMIIRVC